jgi:hypothetical protein
VHALASWLADHPGIDTPDRVIATRYVSELEYPSPADRFAVLQRFAATHGVAVGESHLWLWAAVTIATVATHGVSVEYVLSASKANVRVLPLSPPPFPPSRDGDGGQ